MVAQVDRTNLQIKCVHCHEDYFVRVNEDDLQRYKDGAYAQDAFPYLNADQRELIISQICSICWNKIFGDCDE